MLWFSMRWFVNTNQGCGHFSYVFWSSYEYLIQLSVQRFMCSLNDHISLPIMLTIEPKMVKIVFYFGFGVDLSVGLI
jgi:hypothetical protein